MRELVIALCFALAATPYAFAQEKGKDAERKSSAVAEKPTKSDAHKAKGEEKKSAEGTEKSAKKEPTEKQKAQQARMKDCAAKAGDRTGDERKKFMSECLSRA